MADSQNKSNNTSGVDAHVVCIKRKKSRRPYSLCSKYNYAKKYKKHKKIVFNKTLEAVMQDFGIEHEGILEKRTEEADIKTRKFTSHSKQELESAYKSFISETSKLTSSKYTSVSPKKLLHLHKSHKVVNGIVIPPINSLGDHFKKRKNKTKGMNKPSVVLSPSPTKSMSPCVDNKIVVIYGSQEDREVENINDCSEHEHLDQFQLKQAKVSVDRLGIVPLPPSPVLNLDEKEYELAILGSPKKSVPDLLNNLVEKNVSVEEDGLLITNVWSMSQPGSLSTGDQNNISLPHSSNLAVASLQETDEKKRKQSDYDFVSQTLTKISTETECQKSNSPFVSLKSFYVDPKITHAHGRKRKREEKKKTGKDDNNKRKKLKIKIVHNRFKAKRHLEMLQQNCNELETTSGSEIDVLPTENGWPIDNLAYVTKKGNLSNDTVNHRLLPAISISNMLPIVASRSGPLSPVLRKRLLSNDAPHYISESEGTDAKTPKINESVTDVAPIGTLQSGAITSGLPVDEMSFSNTAVYRMNEPIKIDIKPLNINKEVHSSSNTEQKSETSQSGYLSPKRTSNKDLSLKPVVVLSDVLPALTPNQKKQLRKERDFKKSQESVSEIDPNVDKTNYENDNSNLQESFKVNIPDLRIHSKRSKHSSARELRPRAAPLQVKKRRGEVMENDSDNNTIFEKKARSYKNVRIKKLAEYNEIVITAESVVKKKQEMKLSREYNFLCTATLRDLINAFTISKKQKRCKAVLLSSVGPIFSSGLDPIQLLNWTSVADASHDIVGLFENLVNILIEFDKPIVGAVQGPAVGFGASLLLFCDIIFASERAHFQWPCMQMGLSPFGCVTSLLPQFVGASMSKSLLLQAKLLTAEQAQQCGLVTELFPHDNFMRHTVTACESMCLTQGTVLRHTKKLLQSNHDFKKLHDCNTNEISALKQCLKSNDCQTQLQTYILTQLHMS